VNLSYVANTLKPSGKYCVHKNKYLGFKRAVPSNSFRFSSSPKTEAGITDYSVFSPRHTSE